MRLLFTRRASRDLEAIFAFVSRDSPEAAVRTIGRVQAAAELLADFPGMGRTISGGRLQLHSLSDLPYRIYYRVVRGRELQVIHIRRARRRPLKLQ